MNISSDKVLTMDVNMLMSIVNLKLRDEFSSLTSMCNRYELDQVQLTKRLSEAGFEYDERLNQFR